MVVVDLEAQTNLILALLVEVHGCEVLRAVLSPSGVAVARLDTLLMLAVFLERWIRLNV